MAASTVLFSLFVVAYSDRMLISDWKNMPEPWFLWLNTSNFSYKQLSFSHYNKICSKRYF